MSKTSIAINIKNNSEVLKVLLHSTILPDGKKSSQIIIDPDINFEDTPHYFYQNDKYLLLKGFSQSELINLLNGSYNLIEKIITEISLKIKNITGSEVNIGNTDYNEIQRLKSVLIEKQYSNKSAA